MSWNNVMGISFNGTEFCMGIGCPNILQSKVKSIIYIILFLIYLYFQMKYHLR
jgi:hypothetical protein